MISKNPTDEKQTVGVIGAGKFGLGLTKLLSKNSDVIVYARSNKSKERVEYFSMGEKPILNSNVTATQSFEYIAQKCEVLFPVVPAVNFRMMMRDLAPHLNSNHTLIHGAKGFDVNWPNKPLKDIKISRDDIKTMSRVIKEESNVKKIGCIGGPNLSVELLMEHPAATVIASSTKAVNVLGRKLLENNFFKVYTSRDILGVELCGALKNIFALAAGGLKGLGYGENSKALLISRGMIEMLYIGKFLGASIRPFLGLAGIGDLVATCSSELSRNFQMGYRLAKGEKLKSILKDMNETVEGVNTVKVIHTLLRSYKQKAPFSSNIYKVLFKNMSIKKALNDIISYPMEADIDFL